MIRVKHPGGWTEHDADHFTLDAAGALILLRTGAPVVTYPPRGWTRLDRLRQERADTVPTGADVATN